MTPKEKAIKTIVKNKGIGLSEYIKNGMILTDRELNRAIDIALEEQKEQYESKYILIDKKSKFGNYILQLIGTNGVEKK